MTKAVTIQDLIHLRRVRSGGRDMVTCEECGGYVETKKTCILDKFPDSLICWECYYEAPFTLVDA